jgi:hypothetical protein
MAQQVARVTVNHKVSGSNPLPTVLLFLIMLFVKNLFKKLINASLSFLQRLHLRSVRFRLRAVLFFLRVREEPF